MLSEKCFLEQKRVLEKTEIAIFGVLRKCSSRKALAHLDFWGESGMTDTNKGYEGTRTVPLFTAPEADVSALDSAGAKTNK